jgi:hypothetical protein
LETIFDFVKYKAIFNKSPLDLYFTKIPTQIPFNKMWVQTNMSQISTNLHLGEYSPINSLLYRSTSKFLHIFKFVKPKQFSNLTLNPITIVVNISAKSKFCKETTSLHPEKIQYIPNFFQTSNKFSYPFHQIGDVISHKKYSTIKQIPKRKSFLVWTNVKGTGQIQNPKFQNSNSVAMAKNYL